MTSLARLSLLCAIPMMTMVACTDSGGKSDDTGGNGADDTGGNGADDTGDPQQMRKGTVQGRVASTGSFTASTVSLYQVNSDGSMTAVTSGEADEEAQADVASDGTYMIEVELDEGETYAGLLVMAEGSGEMRSVLLDQTLAEDVTLTAAPIDAETDAEAEIYLDLHADGMWDSMSMNSALLRAMVSAELATALEGSADGSAEWMEASEAMAAGMWAWSGAMTSAMVEGSQSDIDAMFMAMVEAQAELDASLDSATDEDDWMMAYDAFHQSVMSAMTDLEITASDAAVAAQASAEASVAVSSEMETMLHAQLMESMEEMRAMYVQLAVEAELTASGASEGVVDASQAAYAQLQADLEMMSDAGEMAHEEAAEAWSTYRTEVTAQLRAQVGKGRRVAIGVTQTAYAGLATTLHTSLDSLHDNTTSSDQAAQDVLSAMTIFWTSASLNASMSALLDAEYSQVQAEAVLELMAQLYATSAVMDEEPPTQEK